MERVEHVERVSRPGEVPLGIGVADGPDALGPEPKVSPRGGRAVWVGGRATYIKEVGQVLSEGEGSTGKEFTKTISYAATWIA